MNRALTPHPDDELLLRLLDGDLSPAEEGPLDDHLKACGSCRQHLDQVKQTLNDYQQFHEHVLKRAVPVPTRPWERLDLHSAIVHPIRPRLFSSLRWLAAAAAIVLVFMVVRRFGHAPEVKAAELLRKAQSAERTTPARVRSIRITAGRYRLDRAARLSGGPETSTGEAARIRRLLDSAGYSWDDPLSADAFARWHDRLPNKQDSVAESPERYVIHTTTTANAISNASLTLRAADLHAVSCTLRFAVETIEMSELPGEPSPAPAPARDAAEPAPQPAPSASPSRAATLEDELLVIAALHRIGADLGEPVDVRREGPDVLVSVAGLNPQRRDEVQAALSGIPAARLQLQEPDTAGNRDVEHRPAPQVDTANPLLLELQASSPDTADQLTDHTESMIARAYALRGLARRFPTETTAGMTASGKATLSGIIRNHADAISVSAASITRLLSPILPRIAAAPSTEGDTWQDAAQAILVDASRLDQALHSAAIPDDPAARKLRAAQSLADIGRRLAALRTSGPQ